MKKWLLAAFIGLLVGAAAFADHPADKWGVGIVGGGTISSYGYGDVGLSLKIPNFPVFWGIHAVPTHRGFGFAITGDYYFFDNPIVDKQMSNEDGNYQFKLDWYFGVGGFFDLFMWSDVSFNLGVRVPVGVSWHIIKPLELCVGAAPGLGISTWGTFGFHWAIPFEVSLRYWFLGS